MLAGSRTSRPPIVKGLSISPRMRSAATLAWVMSFNPSSRIAKWSPSTRATRSLWRRLGVVSGMRRHLSRRRATAVSTGSLLAFPDGWPGLAGHPRSMSSTAKWKALYRRARSMDCVTRSTSRRRLGSRVSGSVTISTVTSDCEPTSRMARPPLSRTTGPRHDIHRYVPSLWRKRYRHSNVIASAARAPLDLAQQGGAVLWMDSLEPALWRAADFMVLTTGEGDPTRGIVNPAGFQIPVPEPFAVGAGTLRTAGARGRTVSLHVSVMPGIDKRKCR